MLKSKSTSNLYRRIITAFVFLSLAFVVFGMSLIYDSYQRSHVILATVSREYRQLSASQLNALSSGAVFIVFWLIFAFYYLASILKQSSIESFRNRYLPICIDSKMKDRILAAVFLAAFIPYFICAFREIRKTTPGKCGQIKQKHDSVFQTWNYEFRENWEKIYDTSYVFYHMICIDIYRPKVNSLIIGSASTVLACLAIFLGFHK
ncbi:hypothetical protein TRFO_17229 [Tritrichomonas foetus]|uniref:Uncharacterized protein n=1 Tax=Tritrichomonas foetus TaxID=1144522 RepID=A0A1J4KPD5_9EUKA|nr:hypothetical protein TRFO_17229 [Tritrichomonas foetus]|eukprot:OHT12776.1 hypothetical protein TRFO_17229 [Tritrichomonas foetus]